MLGFSVLELVNDRAPWMKNVWFFDSSYIIPNVDSVVLGGTADKGNFDTTVSHADTTRILDGICDLFPAIRSAPVESVWVGLRPGRALLRLDSQEISVLGSGSGSGTIVSGGKGKEKGKGLLVHCYGHRASRWL